MADPDAAALDALQSQLDRLKCADDDGADLMGRVFSEFGRADQVAGALAHAIETACEIANRTLSSGTEGGPGKKERVESILRRLYYLNQAVSATLVSSRMLRLSLASDQETVTEESLVAGMARFAPMDVEDANRMQQLLLYLLNCAQARGYRRHDGDCYARIYTAEGHDTHAWKKEMTMRDFVYDATRKELNYDMWLNATSMRTNVGAAVDHLIGCRDVQLPDLKRDRRVFAFSNGVYLAHKDEFVRYPADLPSDIAAAKYFDADAPDEVIVKNNTKLPGEVTQTDGDDWFAIATPRLQSILDFQKMDDDVSRWMYVMIGRLIYEVGERDGWQVEAFLSPLRSEQKMATAHTLLCGGWRWLVGGAALFPTRSPFTRIHGCAGPPLSQGHGVVGQEHHPHARVPQPL